MIPPLTRSTWPLTQAASGPARKATTVGDVRWAVRDARAAAILAMRSTRSCGLPLRKRSVAVGPGATAFTVMFATT